MIPLLLLLLSLTLDLAVVASPITPNATTSLQFDFLGDPWTWRVNLSQVPATSSQDLKVINTTYDFQWPSSDDLSNYLTRKENASLCATFVTRYFPRNISSRYDTAAKGNCSAIVGDQCQRSLRSAIANITNTCAGLRLDRLAGCEATFDVATPYGAVSNNGAITIPFRGSTNTSGPLSQSQETRPGDRVWGYSTDRLPLPANNLTTYRDAETAVHFLGIRYSTADDPTFRPELLCLMVNKSAIPAESAVPSFGFRGPSVTWISILLPLGLMMILQAHGRIL